MLACFEVWSVGLRRKGRCVRRAVSRYMRRIISIHPDIDSRLPFNPGHYHLGFLDGSVARRQPHESLAAAVLGLDGRGSLVERTDRRLISGRDRSSLYSCHRQTQVSDGVEELQAGNRDNLVFGNSATVARDGGRPQSPDFRLHAAQRIGFVSWVPLVLLHQRTGPALP